MSWFGINTNKTTNVNPNVNQNPNMNQNQNVNQNMNQNMNQNVNQNMNQNMNQNPNMNPNQNSYGSSQSDLKWFRTCIGNSIAAKIEYEKGQTKMKYFSSETSDRTTRVNARNENIRSTLQSVYNMSDSDIKKLTSYSLSISNILDLKTNILNCIITKNKVDKTTQRFHVDETIQQMKSVLQEFINMESYENIRGYKQFGKTALLGITSHVSALGTARGSYQSYQNRSKNGYQGGKSKKAKSKRRRKTRKYK